MYPQKLIPQALSVEGLLLLMKQLMVDEAQQTGGPVSLCGLYILLAKYKQDHTLSQVYTPISELLHEVSNQVRVGVIWHSHEKREDHDVCSHNVWKNPGGKLGIIMLI